MIVQFRSPVQAQFRRRTQVQDKVQARKDRDGTRKFGRTRWGSRVEANAEFGSYYLDLESRLEPYTELNQSD